MTAGTMAGAYTTARTGRTLRYLVTINRRQLIRQQALQPGLPRLQLPLPRLLPALPLQAPLRHHQRQLCPVPLLRHVMVQVCFFKFFITDILIFFLFNTLIYRYMYMAYMCSNKWKLLCKLCSSRCKFILPGVPKTDTLCCDNFGKSTPILTISQYYNCKCSKHNNKSMTDTSPLSCGHTT